MTIRIRFKTPDVMEHPIEDLVQQSMRVDASHFDQEQDADELRKSIRKKLERWIEYGEYVTLEFDLTTMMAKVVPLK